ncbi:MAG: mycothiol synthase [Stackebrandtia sp.]
MEIYERLEPETVAEIIKLAEVSAGADGLAALGEQTVLNLRHGADGPAFHVLSREASAELVGYAYVDISGAEASAEMTVHPMRRNAGLGGGILAAAEERALEQDCASIHIWAHGDHPGALALAHRREYTRSRVLWQMRRHLGDNEPEAAAPDGVRIRAFAPGRDEQKLLTVNNAAFADHPEQGGWTLRDVAMREREDWFDPTGLLLAERVDDAEILGFHWTKVHGSGTAAIGEIYVLGVHPEAQGLKLGGVLTLAGLRHLRGKGLDTVMLYVDESNVAAVRLYTRAGFSRWTTDVNYEKKL